jgi:hypothetical protein
MGMQIGKLMGASLVIGTSTNAQRPLDDIVEALALMRSNQHFGKIVISIG